MSLLLLFHGTGPDPLAAVNTDFEIDVDTTFLIRFRIENTGGEGSTGFKLRRNLNGGAYGDVTTTSTVAKAVAAVAFADGDDAHEVLGGSGTYITGNDAGSEDGTVTLPANFPEGGSVEMVFSVQIVAADVADGDIVSFRVYQSDGTALDAYTHTPDITANEVGGDAEESLSFGLVAGHATAAVTALSASLSAGLVAGTTATAVAAVDESLSVGLVVDDTETAVAAVDETVTAAITATSAHSGEQSTAAETLTPAITLGTAAAGAVTAAALVPAQVLTAGTTQAAVAAVGASLTSGITAATAAVNEADLNGALTGALVVDDTEATVAALVSSLAVGGVLTTAFTGETETAIDLVFAAAYDDAQAALAAVDENAAIAASTLGAPVAGTSGAFGVWTAGLGLATTYGNVVTAIDSLGALLSLGAMPAFEADSADAVEVGFDAAMVADSGLGMHLVMFGRLQVGMDTDSTPTYLDPILNAASFRDAHLHARFQY